MKNEVKGIGMPVNKENLNELLTETKEVSAATMVKERKLTVADLWNIQKQHRPLVIRKWLN